MDSWFPGRAVKSDKRQIGGKSTKWKKRQKKRLKMAISLLEKKYLVRRGVLNPGLNQQTGVQTPSGMCHS